MFLLLLLLCGVLFGAFPTTPPRKYFFHFVLRICLILPFFRRSVTVFLTGWQYAGDASQITRPTNDDAGHGSTESRAKCQPLSQFFCFQADFFPFFLSSHSSFRRIYAKFLCPLWNFSFQRRKFTDFFRNALAQTAKNVSPQTRYFVYRLKICCQP